MLLRFIKNIFRRKKLHIRKSILNPVRKLKGKSNYTDYTRIGKDGSSLNRIMLNLPSASDREKVICNHYLSFLVKNFIEEETGVRIIKRDDPWDFSLELSNGMNFHIEITSIADNKWFFEKKKREELYSNSIDKKEIELKTLKKLSSWFHDETAVSIIEKNIKSNTSSDIKVENPYYQKKVVFVSDTKEEEDSLYDLINKAIKNKSEKKHKEKSKTVLIIDNRTTRFDLEEFKKVSESFYGKLDNVPFPEIYVYTGYYSDLNGNNFEANFLFLKTSNEMSRKYYDKVKSGKIITDKKGINYDSDFKNDISEKF